MTSSHDDWTQCRALCGLTLPLPDPGTGVMSLIPWSLDRLGSSADPLLWSVSSLSPHRMSAARPWNVCRACSAAVCRLKVLQSDQPWPAANPGPGNDQ